MAAEDDLRLAWWEQRLGHESARLGLMTLAAAGAGAEIPWARRGFRWLVARVPGHPFSSFEGLADALDDPRMVARLCKLRRIFPPGKVAWQVLRADAIRGPYLGRRDSLAQIIDELWPVSSTRRRSVAVASPFARLGVARAVDHRHVDASISA